MSTEVKAVPRCPNCKTRKPPRKFGIARTKAGTKQKWQCNTCFSIFTTVINEVEKQTKKEKRPRCKQCHSRQVIKYGFRYNSEGIIQQWKCQNPECKATFGTLMKSEREENQDDSSNQSK